MSERLEKLRREVEHEKALLMQELGLSFTGPLLVMGSQNASALIQGKLARIPAPLRAEAESKLMSSLVRLPWLDSRRVGGRA